MSEIKYLSDGKKVSVIGKINKIEGEVVTLQIDQKTFIKVLKS